MPGLAVSLITYTYNDGRFVDGLLADLPRWTMRPDEIVIVDDGSEPPYAPAPGISPAAPPRLIRHAANMGIPATKHEGIGAGRGDLLLAMDCDTRLHPSWLEWCLPHALRPEVGMVAGPVAYLSGEDLVSRYLRAFGDNHNLGADGPANFIPGNAFLLRREVWEAAGGMAGFTGEVCEDHFLCGRIRALGLLLWIEGRAAARQTRRITRQAMFRRFWSWCHLAVKRQAEAAPDVPAYIFAALAAPHAERVEDAIRMEEPLFLYLEAVYLSFTALDLLDSLAAKGRAGPEHKAAWWACLRGLFSRLPRLWALLRADLARLGQPEAKGGTGGPDNPYAPSFTALDALAGGGVFRWLDEAGMRAILADESATAADFSCYEAFSFGPAS